VVDFLHVRMDLPARLSAFCGDEDGWYRQDSGVEQIRRRVICDVDVGVVLLRLRC
jgi:hypothetical protein